MKNLILAFIASIIFSLFFISCSEEALYDPSIDAGTFSFEISVPASEMRTRSDDTRAYGDGNTVCELKCYVYSHNSEASSLPLQAVPVVIKNGDDGNRTGSLSLDLPSGNVYDFVFLATSCKQDSKDSKLYFNPEERSLNVNYQKISGNDEDLDCFYGIIESASVAKGSSYKVSLKRPMAQLNIGTKDLADYDTMSVSPIQSVAVSVEGVYSSMNVMNGKVIGQPVKVNVPAAVLPSGQSFPATDAAYLSMNYFLVNERKDVAVTMTANNGISSFDCEFADVPLQRNHQTNVYGNLLTKENNFKVEINPDFLGSSNKNVEDPYEEYDLVVKYARDNGQIQRYMFTYNDELGNKHTIYLKDYLDKDNYVKVTWKELGINENTSHIQFENTYTYENGNNFINEHYDPYLISVLKLNISYFDKITLDGLFASCIELANVDAIKNWDTSNVTDMSHMFNSCYKLTYIDMSHWDTSNVTDMSYMFYHTGAGSFGRGSINVSNFNTSKVTNMSHMFSECNSSNLDVSHFDTSNVTEMDYMFYKCKYLLSPLDLSNFNTSKVTNMSHMFSECNSSNLDVSHFDTSNVTEMDYMCFPDLG